MNLELMVSQGMSRSGESDCIRMSKELMLSLGVVEGKKLSLTTYSGASISLRVCAMETVGSISYVTQTVLDSITGDTSHPLEVTLGCDPEFVFLNSKNNMVPTNTWLPASGSIGSDGPLAELRPLPAYHESGVVENLRSLIKALPLLIYAKFGNQSALSPQAHSCWENQAMGFHIHVSAPIELLTFAAPTTKVFLESFITALDYFVGVPAMLLEDTNVRRLGGGMYGNPGDYRVGPKTIEYRTPGGFHLRHPSYAAGIMGLALCVSEELLNEYRNLTNGWRSLNKYSSFEHIKKRYNLPNKSEIRGSLLEPTKKDAVEQLPNMLKQLKSFNSFTAHDKAITTYFKLLASNTQFSPNILDNW